MKVSKGHSQLENCCGRLFNSLHGSGFTISLPGFDSDPHLDPFRNFITPFLNSGNKKQRQVQPMVYALRRWHPSFPSGRFKPVRTAHRRLGSSTPRWPRPRHSHRLVGPRGVRELLHAGDQQLEAPLAPLALGTCGLGERESQEDGGVFGGSRVMKVKLGDLCGGFFFGDLSLGEGIVPI